MTNLRAGSTVNNSKIITEDIVAEHRHTVAQIMGLTDAATGQGEIYAEKIDGYTYNDLQNIFVSESNTTMTGPLVVTGAPSSDNSIVSKGEADSLFESFNVENYNIAQLDPISIEFSNNSILASNERGYIDPSWTGGEAFYPVNISIDGSLADINVGETREFKITNYNAFYFYTVSTNIGTVVRVGDTITYTAPETNDSDIAVTITVTQGSVSKTLSFTLLKEVITRRFENRQSLTRFSNSNTYFYPSVYSPEIGHIGIFGRTGHSGSGLFIKNDDLTTSIAKAYTGFVIMDVAIKPDNTIIAVGYDNRDTSFFPVIYHLDASLNTIKRVKFSVSGILSDVLIDSQGYIVASGTTFVPYDHIFIVRVDDNLDVIDQVSLGDSAEQNSSPYGMVEVANDIIIVGQALYSDHNNHVCGVAIRLDSVFNIVDEARYVKTDLGSSISFSSVDTNGSGTLYISGVYQHQANDSYLRGLIGKIDFDLNIVSMDAYVNSDSVNPVANALGVAVEDGTDTIYVTGIVDAQASDANIYIFKYDYNSKNVLNAVHVPNNGLSSPTDIDFIDGYGVAVSFYQRDYIEDANIDLVGGLLTSPDFSTNPGSVGPIEFRDLNLGFINANIKRESTTRTSQTLNMTTEPVSFTVTTETVTTEINNTY